MARRNSRRRSGRRMRWGGSADKFNFDFDVEDFDFDLNDLRNNAIRFDSAVSDIGINIAGLNFPVDEGFVSLDDYFDDVDNSADIELSLVPSGDLNIVIDDIQVEFPSPDNPEESLIDTFSLSLVLDYYDSPNDNADSLSDLFFYASNLRLGEGYAVATLGDELDLYYRGLDRNKLDENGNPILDENGNFVPEDEDNDGIYDYDGLGIEVERFYPSLSGNYIFSTMTEFDNSVGPNNTSPDAIDDSFSTDEATPITFDVLLNDTDAEEDILTIEFIDTTDTLGKVTDNGDGTFDYDPNGAFENLSMGETATDTFTYWIADEPLIIGDYIWEADYDTATVSITINGSDDGGSDDTAINGTVEADELYGTNRDDNINGLGGNDTLRGLDGNDFLDGGEDRDFLRGDRGNDTLNGGAGDDTLRGSTGDDLIDGGDGNDFIKGDRDRDTIDGGLGNDTIQGNNQDDLLNGGAGDDLLIGGGRKDTLRGGTGNDTLKGNKDTDIFVLAAGEGTDTIQDFRRGTDTIGLADGLTFADLSFSGKDITFGTETLATLNIAVANLSESDFAIV